MPIRATCVRGIPTTTLLYPADDAAVLVAEFRGQAELDVLTDTVHLLDLDLAEPAQGLDDVQDQFLGRRGAGGQADGLHARQPRRIELGAVGDQVAGQALLDADLAQAVGVGAVAAPTTRITSATLHRSRTADWRCWVA